MIEELSIIRRSYYEALTKLSARRQSHIYNAIFGYAFNQVEPENLDKIETVVWTLIRPQLDEDLILANFARNGSVSVPTISKTETVVKRRGGQLGNNNARKTAIYAPFEEELTEDINEELKTNKNEWQNEYETNKTNKNEYENEYETNKNEWKTNTKTNKNEYENEYFPPQKRKEESTKEEKNILSVITVENRSIRTNNINNNINNNRSNSSNNKYIVDNVEKIDEKETAPMFSSFTSNEDENENNLDIDIEAENDLNLESEEEDNEVEEIATKAPQPKIIRYIPPADDPKDDGIFDIKAFIDYFNQLMKSNKAAIPLITCIQGKRLRLLKARLAQHGKRAVADAILHLAKSEFLNGRNSNTGRVFTFDWVIAPNNFLKVIEGNFTNRIIPKGSGYSLYKYERDKYAPENFTAEDYEGDSFT